MSKQILALVPLLFALGVSSAHARPGGGHHGGPKLHKLMKQLELTQEQKEKIKADREKRKPEMKAARERAKAAREKLREAFKQNLPAEQLRALKTEAQAAQAAIADARFEGMLAIREVLTPEQRAKFNQWQEKRQGKAFPGRDDDDGDDE